jgi:methionine-rich copper-binding protein CopC
MLDHSEPAQDAKLASSPAQITLFFTQNLKASGSWVLLEVSGGGEVQVQVQFDPADTKVMRAMVPPLDPGVYAVRWQSQSADDDDYAGGRFSFTVLNPDGSVPKGTSDSGQNASGRGSGGSDVALTGAAAVVVVVVVGFTVFALTRKRT